MTGQGDYMDETGGTAADSGKRELEKGSALYVTLGFISAIISLFIYPFFFGVLGVIMGILATKRGSRAGVAVIIANIVLMGAGMIYGPVLRNYFMQMLGI